MAENDNRAERIAEALFGDQDSRFTTDFEDGRFRPKVDDAFEAAQGIFISDVTDHARRFYSQAAIFEEFGEDMPCVSMGDFEYAPIEIFNWLPQHPYLARRFYHEFYYMARDAARYPEIWAGLTGEKEQVRYFSPRQSLGFVRRGVARFLNSRFSGTTTSVSYAPVPFTLHNQNPNHQIYFSSPYYLAPTVFGGPSTPVTQHLHPGIYVFGVMGPVIHNNHTPQFETASQFDIPRLHTSGTLVTI